MNEDQFNQSDIERNEVWLAEQMSAVAAGDALDRVKAAVRAQLDGDSVDADVRERLTRVKSAVRTELAVGTVDDVMPPVVAFRPVAPLLAAAAAVAFAFVGFSGGVDRSANIDPDLDLFVSVLADEDQEVTTADALLSDLAMDVAYLESSEAYLGELGGDFDVLLDEVERVLDGESREGAS